MFTKIDKGGKFLENQGLSAWKIYFDHKKEAEKFIGEVKNFFDEVKTEKEAVTWFVEQTKKLGGKAITEANNLKPGDIVYLSWKDRAFIYLLVGENKLDDGIRIVASHSDSPRIDIKMRPFYEDSNILFMDTQYYGGIKAYQWANIPLQLRGEVFTTDGKKINIQIGTKEDDPIFVIPDIEPHTDRKLSERKASETIKAENLDAIAGGMIPQDNKEEKNPIKSAILKLLEEKYGIKEDDFSSAELYLVPSFKTKDVGFDGAFIAGYGLDDRICSIIAFKAITQIKQIPKHSCMFLSVDKEEIGSEGLASAQSKFLDVFLEMLIKKLYKQDQPSVNEVLIKSETISADVTAAVHPLHKELYDPNNSAKASCGVAIVKYTGGRGKSYASEAPAEFIAEIRKRLEKKNIPWQPGIIAKVDIGGGGTIAKFLARYGMPVLDMGIPLISMHSPYELASKADIYATKEAYFAFYTE